MPDKEKLEKLFMHKVLKMMMSRDKINEDVIERLMSWTHSGFNVYIDDEIPPHDIQAREKAVHYLCKPCISLEKMSYKEGKVIYGESHNAKVCDPLDFLACSPAT